MQKLRPGRITLLGFCCLLPLASWSAHADTSGVSFSGFDDIQFWTGSGTNRAALVIQWNDGKAHSSLVWGYRWNNTATGFDMLRSVIGYSAIHYPGSTTNHAVFLGADSRLMASWSQFDFGNALDSVVFKDGTIQRYQNDWNTGFWEYSLFGGQFSYDVFDESGKWLETASYNQLGSVFFSGVTWFSSPFGASDRILVNGSWDAWSFAADFRSVPVTTPQPASLPPPVAKSIRLLSSSQIEIVFQTIPNSSCRLESNPGLQPSNWTPHGDPFTATNSETTLVFSIQPQDPRQFYRLKQIQ